MWAGISGGAEKLIELPKPRLDSEASLEQVLKTRRSVRSFLPEPLSLVELSQLLWATQGISSQRLRTVPSAGALYHHRYEADALRFDRHVVSDIAHVWNSSTDWNY